MEMVAEDIFHVISRGIAIKDMQVFCGGMVWGLDMILSNQKLRKMKPAIALTFLETSALSRSDFTHVLERFPREKSKVRRSVIWLVFRRKFTSHAQEIEAMTDQLSRVLRRDVLNGIIDVREVFKKCDKNGCTTNSINQVQAIKENKYVLIFMSRMTIWTSILECIKARELIMKIR